MKYKTAKVTIAGIIATPILLIFLHSFGTLTKTLRGNFNKPRPVNSNNFVKSRNKTVILGIGTGRCGTLAFSKLLNQQLFSDITHEWKHCEKFEWDAEFTANIESSVNNQKKFERVQSRYYSYLKRPGSIVGDVALWNLPYVETFLNNFENVKVIAIRRNKKDTVKSFSAYFKGMKHFPWMSDEERAKNTSYLKNSYDKCYPKFDFGGKRGAEEGAPSIETGAEKYYSYYYAEVTRLLNKYPEKVVEIDSYEVLNDLQVQINLLRWAGFKTPFLLGKETGTAIHQKHKGRLKEIKAEFGGSDIRDNCIEYDGVLACF